MPNQMPTIQCPNCGAFERIGTARCFSCGASMDGTDEPTDVGRPLFGRSGVGRSDVDTESDRSAGAAAWNDGDAATAASGTPRPWTAEPYPPPTVVDGRGGGPPPGGPFDAATYGYGQGYGGYGTGYGMPPPGYGYGGYGYGYVAPQQEKGATTALVLGLVGFVCCGILLGPAAIVEGYKARRRIAESQGALTGDGMALAGMILGAVAFVLNVGLLVLQLIVVSSTPTTRYR